MARYKEAVCRLCRREGQKLYLKGHKCYTSKCTFERKGYAPGMHGERSLRTRKPSDFGVQLREKQKLRRIYGVMERQFHRYYERAARAKGVTGDELLRLLERRLDNVVYRAGFATSRAEARHMVSRRHFMVNGRIVDRPSFLVRPNDVVEVKQSSRNKAPIIAAASTAGGRPSVSWLNVDLPQLTATVVSLPERQEIDSPVDEQLVVEYYSR
ncbi:MAG: 30S ribosomal protein S4 [Armatimonadota bacterium]